MKKSFLSLGSLVLTLSIISLWVAIIIDGKANDSLLSFVIFITSVTIYNQYSMLRMAKELEDMESPVAKKSSFEERK